MNQMKRNRHSNGFVGAVSGLFLAAALSESLAQGAPGSGGNLDFYKDIHPFLEGNCLPCHNKTTSKAKLNLESPASLRKGGESGPGAIPGKGDESLVFQSASHLGDSIMPPKDNKSGAVRLKPEQLALLRTWIDQGAADSVKTRQSVTLGSLPKRTQPIHSVAVSPDGRFAVCSRADRLYAYDLAAKVLVDTLSDPGLSGGAAHLEMIHALDFSRDGSMLASGGFREVKVWRREPGKIERSKVEGLGVVSLCAISPDGKRVLFVDASGVRLRACENGADAQVVEGLSGDSVGALAFSPDGGAVAFCLKGGAVRLVSTGKTELLKQFQATDGVKAVAWSADSKSLLLGVGSSVEVWSPENGSKVREIKTPVPNALALSRDGKTLAVGGADGVVRLIDFGTGTGRLELKTDSESDIKARDADWKAARAELDASFHAGVVAQLDAQDKTLDLHEKRAKEAIATAQKLLPEKKKALEPALAAKAEAEKALDEISAALKAEEKASPATLAKQKEAVTKLAAAVTAANSAVSAVDSAQNHITDGEQKLIQITEAKAANALRRTHSTEARKSALALQESEKNIAAGLRKSGSNSGLQLRAVAFSGSGQRVSALFSDGVQTVWSASSGTRLERFSLAPGVASAGLVGLEGERFVALEAGGVFVTAGPSKSWMLWKTFGGVTADSPLVDRVYSVRFSPDGRSLATGGGEASRSGDIHIWDVESGRLKQTWSERHSDTVLSLDFSADGKWLASGGADRMARVSEVSGGRLLLTLEGHTHHVLGVAFRADSRYLATAGGDGVVNIWNTESGERSKKIPGWNKEVTALQFQGATNTIVTSAADNQIRLVKDDGTEVRVISKLPDVIQTAKCAPGLTWIVGGGEDSVLRLWDGADGTELAAFNSP